MNLPFHPPTLMKPTLQPSLLQPLPLQPLQQRLIRYLQEELLIPKESIAVALRHEVQTPNLLAMVLWQYGLVTIDQLDKIFDWLETAS